MKLCPAPFSDQTVASEPESRVAAFSEWKEESHDLKTTEEEDSIIPLSASLVSNTSFTETIDDNAYSPVLTESNNVKSSATALDS